MSEEERRREWMRYLGSEEFQLQGDPVERQMKVQGLLFIVAALVASIVMVIAVLIGTARGAERTACEAQPVRGDKHHWAFRVIDGRTCWYRGERGWDKSRLYWATEELPPPSWLAAPDRDQGGTSSTALVDDPDQELANTCCWPPLEPTFEDRWSLTQGGAR